MKEIILFSTYFASSNPTRQAEIDSCLFNNLSNNIITAVNLFVDPKDEIILLDYLAKIDSRLIKKLKIIPLGRIPSYKDWLDNTDCKDVLSAFANADIYFDSSIARANDILSDHEDNLICLSRHDVFDGNYVPHAQPHWSQDAWIINSNCIQNIGFINDLNIKTSLCRCDNQMAYFFAINGWNLFNNYKEIICYHLHRSKVRNYDKKDRDIYGHTAFVHPTSCDQPSDLDICIFPVKKRDNIKKCFISEFLCDQ